MPSVFPRWPISGPDAGTHPNRVKKQNPGSPRYTGDYEDGFGNKITVLAVSNPTRTDREPQRLHQRAPGYGIVRFNRDTREITFENWPRWASPFKDKPYPGWPVRVFQEDNYSRVPSGYLPPITVTGMENPVFQVVNQGSGEIVYTIRAKTSRFTPMVFEEGAYTVRVGEPGTDNFQTLTDLSPAAIHGEEEIRVRFDGPDARH